MQHFEDSYLSGCSGIGTLLFHEICIYLTNKEQHTCELWSKTRPIYFISTSSRNSCNSIALRSHKSEIIRNNVPLSTISPTNFPHYQVLKCWPPGSNNTEQFPTF